VEGIEVVGEAGDVQEAVGGIKRAKPDSVIVALRMLGGCGLDVLYATKSTNPASIAIILAEGPCSECEEQCFAMGADYFFEKSGEMKKIITTLVLLAHHSDQQGVGEEPEASRSFASRPVGTVKIIFIDRWINLPADSGIDNAEQHNVFPC
jgi:DNA-binding NarL/FixJ family response regulator